jgi:hypothetical protein
VDQNLSQKSDSRSAGQEMVCHYVPRKINIVSICRLFYDGVSSSGSLVSNWLMNWKGFGRWCWDLIKVLSRNYPTGWRKPWNTPGRIADVPISPKSYMHSSSPHACYMLCPSYSPWLSHSNYTRQRVQVMKLFIIQRV